MAWIESHQELRGHPKTKRLARSLSISLAEAVGHLHFLWWWSLDYAQDGVLTDYEDWEIADAAGYEGDPAAFQAAMVAAGFLDETDGALVIHDWTDYGGKSMRQREQARKRTQRRREKQNSVADTNAAAETETVADAAGTDVAADTTAEDTQLSHVCHADVTRDTCVESACTGQDRTRQDITGQDSTSPLPPAGRDGDGFGVNAGQTVKSVQDERFAEFWSLYPRKQGKGAALKAWAKIKPDGELFATIVASVQDNVARNAQWQREGGRFIPMPATWLNQTRWLDEIQAYGGDRNGGGVNVRTGDDADFWGCTGFGSADIGTGADVQTFQAVL